MPVPVPTQSPSLSSSELSLVWAADLSLRRRAGGERSSLGPGVELGVALEVSCARLTPRFLGWGLYAQSQASASMKCERFVCQRPPRAQSSQMRIIWQVVQPCKVPGDLPLQKSHFCTRPYLGAQVR
jgi:hypothetical protein